MPRPLPKEDKMPIFGRVRETKKVKPSPLPPLKKSVKIFKLNCLKFDQ
jgi:hypothetical protein